GGGLNGLGVTVGSLSPSPTHPVTARTDANQTGRTRTAMITPRRAERSRFHDRAADDTAAPSACPEQPERSRGEQRKQKQPRGTRLLGKDWEESGIRESNPSSQLGKLVPDR